MKIPELHARFDERAGVILCPPEWFAYEAELRAELLKDWIYGLERVLEATELQISTDEVLRKAMKK